MKALIWIKSILGLGQSKEIIEDTDTSEISRVVTTPIIEETEAEDPKCPEIETEINTYSHEDKTQKISSEVIDVPPDVTQLKIDNEQVSQIPVTEGDIPEQTLLDNTDYIKLVSENCHLLEKLDGLSDKMSDEASLKVISYVKKQLRTCLVNSGASTIDEECVFSLLRHEPVEEIIAKNGEQIDETIEPGIAVENRVFVKAKVTIKR